MKNLKVGDKVRCKEKYLKSFTYDKEYTIVSDGNIIDDFGTTQRIYDNGENGREKWFNENFEHFTHTLPPAVLVQNERELKAVITEFDRRGWSPFSGTYHRQWNPDLPVLSINDSYGCYLEQDAVELFTILSFTQFALIAGIEVPNEDTKLYLDCGMVLIDEDGVTFASDMIGELSKSDLDKIITAYQSLKK